MIYESGHPEAKQAGQVVHQRVAVFGGGEDRPVAGEGVAAEGSRATAQAEVEFLARHWILEPAALQMQDRDVPVMRLEDHGTAQLHRAGVQSRRGVETVRSGIEVGKAAGKLGTDAPA